MIVWTPPKVVSIGTVEGAEKLYLSTELTGPTSHGPGS